MRRRELRLKRGITFAAAAALTALVGGPASARAQACASSALRFALPADGASDVPRDASLRGYYGVGARFAAESVFLGPGARLDPIGAEFDRSTGVLSVTPARPLDPGVRYTVVWPALLSAGGSGRATSVAFTTSDALDDSPPAVDTISSLDWDVVSIDDACIGRSIERYVFDVSLAGARDDGGAASLEASVYLTRGPLLGATTPPRLVATEPLVDGTRAVRVTLPREDSLGEVCFSALVRDLHGRASAATPERCVVTERPPFFRSCAVVAPGARGVTFPAIGAVVLAVAVLSSRRRTRVPFARERRNRAAR